MLGIRLVLCLAVVLGPACGGEPRSEVRPGPVRVDPICENLGPRIDQALEMMRKQEMRAQVESSPAGTAVTREELRRIDRAQHRYNQLRGRGVTFGCVAG